MAQYTGATLRIELPNGEELEVTLKSVTLREAKRLNFVDLVEHADDLDISEVPFVQDAVQELLSGKTDRLATSATSSAAGAE